MKIVLQRVKQASVSVDGVIVGQIGTGILLLVGVHKNDTQSNADVLAKKCSEVRIFPDESGKMNRSLCEVGGSVLVVSQFTLLADCSHGRRPSFGEAASPDKGNELYKYFVSRIKQMVPDVATGTFGAMMDVSLINDGPVTLLLEH